MLLKTKMSSSDLSLFKMLVISPALAVTTTLSRALAMSIAAVAVLVISELLVSLIRKIIPVKIRVVVYLAVTALAVSLVSMIMDAISPQAAASLGVYLPILAVSCVVIMRIESFAAENAPGASLIDALVTGAEFTAVMMVSALIRELLGTGKLFAAPGGNGGVVIFPQAPVSFLATPAGALLLIALIAAAVNYVSDKRAKKASSGEDDEIRV